MKEIDATFVKTNRGGDITYHGFGQLVGYPILDLEQFFTDIHKYLRLLEEAIILTIAEYGLSGDRVESLTGVWLEQKRKICAIGIHCSRWVTAHGFALNVSNDLNEFSYIIPCGIHDKEVTSINQERQKKIQNSVSLEDVQNICTRRFLAHFL